MRLIFVELQYSRDWLILSSKKLSTSPDEIERPNAVPRSLLMLSLSAQTMPNQSVQAGLGLPSAFFQ
jgi:hypothetical protein